MTRFRYTGFIGTDDGFLTVTCERCDYSWLMETKDTDGGS